MTELVIANGTVVSPEQGVFPADIAITGETIESISEQGTESGDEVLDASGKHVFPGVVDPHTHHGIFQSLKEDARSESRSGLVGGVTTTGNIFRRGDPYLEIMDGFFETAEANYHHDFFFTLGLLSETHVKEIPAIVDEFSITSFKWYMNYKLDVAKKFGLDRNLLDDIADSFIERLSNIDVPTTLAYHSENAEITKKREEELRTQGATGYGAIVDRFPDYVEAQSMVSGANLARQHDYDDRFYVVHVSSKRTADELAELQSMGYEITGETCTHYLCLTSDESDERMKINPPIRSQSHQDALWRRLADGTLSVVGTDHIANQRQEKIGDNIWDTMWGSPSSATLLPLVISEGYHKDRLDLQRVAAVTSTNAATAYELYPRKGTLRVGSDADLTVVDLNETKTVTPDLLKSAADYSMYTGRQVTGWPTHTIVRGEILYENGSVTVGPGYGEHIDRPIDVAVESNNR